MQTWSRFLAAVLVTAAVVANVDAADVRTGEVFEPFTAKDFFTGEEISIEKLRGKVVLVDFWATWCRPCVAEIPHVKRAYDEFKDQGLEIISISLDRRAKDLKRFVEARKLTWHHVFDRAESAKLARRYNVVGIPAMFVVGRDGKVAAVKPRGKDLHVAIARAIRQGGEPDVPLPDRSPRANAAANAPTPPPDQMIAAADARRAERWLRIADGMLANGNDRLARKYFEKVAHAYPETRYENAARSGLERAGRPSKPVEP